MKSEDEAASCDASRLQGSVGAVRKSFFLYQQLSGSRNKTLLQGCSFRQFDRDGLATAMWRKLNGKVHDGTDWLFSRHVDRSTAPSSRGPACQTLYLEKVNNRTGIAFRVMSDEHLLLAVSSAIRLTKIRRSLAVAVCRKMQGCWTLLHHLLTSFRVFNFKFRNWLLLRSALPSSGALCSRCASTGADVSGFRSSLLAAGSLLIQKVYLHNPGRCLHRKIALVNLIAIFKPERQPADELVPDASGPRQASQQRACCGMHLVS